MGALPRTPERVIDRHSPETPVTQRQLRRLDTQARRGELRAEELISKYKKATEKLVAKVEFLEADIERRDAAEALNKAARGGGKRTRYPQGQLFDTDHRERHVEELAARKEREKQAREQKRRLA